MALHTLLTNTVAKRYNLSQITYIGLVIKVL
jgi:hypothetical protein